MLLYLQALFLLAVHIFIIDYIYEHKNELKGRTKNLAAIYLIYLLVMLGYMLNNVFWNFLTPEIWLEKFLHVFVNPIDNFSALVTAWIIRSVFGEMELI